MSSLQICLSGDAAFKEIQMFKRKCCATMNNTHDAAYAAGCVSSGCGGSKIARTFDFQGQDAIISTTTNYPNNYVESTDIAEEFNYSESKSTDDQSCLAMFVPPKATDIIEESNWGNDA